MTNGIPDEKDADTLACIYRKINMFNGTLKEPLTVSEIALIFHMAKYVRKNFGGKNGKE